MSEKPLVNQIIEKLKKGKSGTGQYGAWTSYRIKFKDNKQWFSWFAKETDIAPSEGMKLLVVNYEITQSEKDGTQYTNYNIKRMEFDDSDSIINSDKPNSQATTYSNEKDLSFYASYAKDLIVAQMPFREDLQKADHSTLCDAIILRGKRMLTLANGGKVNQSKPKPKPKPEPKQEEKYPPPDDDDLPF